MNHMIESTDNVLSVREMPWHRLGVVLPDYPTREQAQAIAHPWEPETAPTYRAVTVPVSAQGDTFTDYQPIPGSKVVTRSDNGSVLGVVNDTLGLVSNTELWDVAEAVGAADGQVRIETAGSLEGGKRVWVLLRLAEPIRVTGDPQGDTVAYFALQNSHDGGGSFRGQAVNTRIVCANTSSAADAEAKRTGYEFTFRHTARVSQRVEDAKRAVTLWRAGIDQWTQAMEALTRISITPAGVDAFVTEFHPMPPRSQITDRVAGNVTRARAQLRGILDGQTSEGVSRTAYGLAQAGIEWSQHYRRTTGGDERARMESHFKRAMLTPSRLNADVIRLAQSCALI